jgi:hypothetical protein
MIDIEEKAFILSEFNDLFDTKEGISPSIDNFFIYNDLGFPIVDLMTRYLVVPTTDGEEVLNETWSQFCKLFGVDEETIDDEFFVEYNDDETINIEKTKWLSQFLEIADKVNPNNLETKNIKPLLK